VPGGLAEQRDGGVAIAVTSGSGHGQPQAVADHQQRRGLGLGRCAVAAATRWRRTVRADRQAVGGWLDRQMPSQAA
jgi:hypothetical protein